MTLDFTELHRATEAPAQSGMGRPENTIRNDLISILLAFGMTWTNIMKATNCGHSTVTRIARRRKAAGNGSFDPNG
jgi:DNA invertase Pin-like site-specific DNA recombinase